MDEHEPHRPNYDELKKAHEAAQEQAAKTQSERTEAHQESERKPTRPEGHPGDRSPGGPTTGRMTDHFDWAREQAKLKNQRIQEQEPEPQNVSENDKPKAQPEQPKPEPTPEQPTRPEKNQADWRRLLNDPDYRRQDAQQRESQTPQRQQTQEPQPSRPAGDQPEKKAEEKEVDWRRVLTDPDYRREVKQREREAVGQEKVSRQERQEGEQRAPSGRDR